jgi:MFS family permease
VRRDRADAGCAGACVIVLARKAGAIAPDAAPAMPPGFRLLIAAQFTSALADNAVLIVAIALVHDLGYAAWWAPLLKFAFTIAYVALAPLVGPFADALPKARLMAWMNALKVIGLVGLMLGGHPLACFAIIGIGAAAYAPAKYGLVTELVPPPRLVAANAWLEVSIVSAVLLGTVCGGALVADLVRASAAAQAARTLVAGWGGVDSTLAASLAGVLLVYALAALLNLGIAGSGARYPRASVHPAALLRDFARANRLLWADRDGGLSLAVTTVFWGAGATLQFAVLRWAVDRLGLTLEHAAYLQAMVAIGVVAGASVAGRCVPLAAARRVMGAGVALGLLVPAVAHVTSVGLAVPLLVLAGAAGGFLVVPMNALLQHRGFCLMSAGRSVAVQGFNENLGVLVMLAAYAALLRAQVPIVVVMWLFGLGVATLMAALLRRERRRRDAVAPA